MKRGLNCECLGKTNQKQNVHIGLNEVYLHINHSSEKGSTTFPSNMNYCFLSETFLKYPL